MSLKFGQIQPLVSIVTDRVLMEKTVSPLFSAVFHLFLFVLAGNDDMHESSDEFKGLEPIRGFFGLRFSENSKFHVLCSFHSNHKGNMPE